MRFVAGVGALLVMALVVHGGLLVCRHGRAELAARLQRDVRGILGTLPAGPARDVMAARAAPRDESLGALVRASVVLRATLGWRAAPLLGALLLVGVSAGLLLRGRLAEGRGYASVTGAYLARAAVAVGLALFAFTSIAPCGAPPWGTYAGSVVACVGVAIYVGNLPPRM